ncbi:flagellin [Methanosarcina sp. Ant1]|nr:flagellin [Methanosarcina sp. Ant1]
MSNKFVKNEKGFTGLEAAIVLIAFVVVAAVFSYVMLGAGFFTTQKSQEVVHTGVTQASSSVELSGNVISQGGIEGAGTVLNEIDTVDMFMQLTSGGSEVDIGKTLIVVSAPGIPPTELTYVAGVPTASKFGIREAFNDNGDLIVDKGETFDIQIDLDAIANAASTTIGANKDFTVEIKPPSGAPYIVRRVAPPTIKAIMTLV